MRMHSYVILLLACLMATACNPTPRDLDGPGGQAGADTPDPFVAMMRDHGLRVYWDRSSLLENNEQIERMFLLDENVYYLTNNNTMLCQNARTGQFKWAYNVAPAGRPVFAPAHVDEVNFPDDLSNMAEILDPDKINYVQSFDAVTINTLSYVLLLDRNTGRVVRSQDEGLFNKFAADDSGVSDGSNYFVGSPTGRCYGIDMVVGVEIWREDAEGSVTAAVRYYNDRVYFASYDGKLRCFKTRPKIEFQWAKITPGPLVANFLIHRGRLLLPCETNRLYCLDALNGDEIWEGPFITRGELRADVQASEDTVFQYAENDGLYAVDLHTGKQRWHMTEGRYVAAVLEGVAYVMDANKGMHLIDELTGEESAVIDMSRFTLILPNANDTGIYTVGEDQATYCFRPLSAGYLTPEMLAD